MTILLCQWQQLRIKQVIVINIIKQTIQYIIITSCTVISMTQLLMVTDPSLLASGDLIISAAVAVVTCFIYECLYLSCLVMCQSSTDVIVLLLLVDP